MSRFNDKYLHTIDQRGRLQLPRDFRTVHKVKKGDVFHLLPNPNNPDLLPDPPNPPFLEVRTKVQWEEYQNRLMAQESSEGKRDIFRLIQMDHVEVTADGQGRFVIPPRLRDACAFDSEVAVINMASFVEVWNKEAVQQKYNDMLKAFNEINNQLF